MHTQSATSTGVINTTELLLKNETEAGSFLLLVQFEVFTFLPELPQLQAELFEPGESTFKPGDEERVK